MHKTDTDKMFTRPKNREIHKKIENRSTILTAHKTDKLQKYMYIREDRKLTVGL